MKCEYWIALGWIVAYIITVTCVTLWPVVLIILIMILLYGCCILKYIFTSMSVKDWLNKNWIFVTMSIVLVFFFILWNKGVICIHAIANANLNSKDEAVLSYNIVNTISGILTPLLSFGAVVAAFGTLRQQRKQNELAEFENHLFQMIDQQHKLEEKVIAKHGSFRELYNQFCYIYKKSKNELEACRFEKEDCLKIAYYIFYFGIDKDFVCDNTGKWMKDKINNDKQYMLVLKKLNSISSPLFHRQKSEELGIYYRNLFNAIRYIDWECPDENKKNEYARLVRTNISDFAQLMLYYNMQGERGSAWLDKTELEIKNPQGGNDCLLSRYKPIKNCAINVENSDIDPREDNRKEFFSQEVIEYELKIATKDKC